MLLCDAFITTTITRSEYPKRLIEDIKEKMPQLNEKLKSEARIVNMLQSLKV